MDYYEILAKQADLTRDEINTFKTFIESGPIINKIIKILKSQSEKVINDINDLEFYNESPYLKKSSRTISFSVTIDRHYIEKHEFGKKINEKHGTMYFFKERTKELANIAGLDGDEMRMAFGEGIQNILEHGKGKYVDVKITVNNINTSDVYLEMSFKHTMPTMQFYSINSANQSADTGILNMESPRGRGEFLMREIMDERKFLNGMHTGRDGHKEYFFQRIMRKYKHPKKKSNTKTLTNEFKQYIENLNDYHSALFVRMDYFNNTKELVISQETGNLESVKNIMKKNGYSLNGSDIFRDKVFSLWITKH